MDRLKTRIIGRYEYALFAILILNALLKWRFFSGLVAADDFSYAVYAYSMWRIPMPWDLTMDFRVLRLALILPVALLFRILPPTVFVTVAYPMAMSFGTVVLVYLIGRKLYGQNAGLLAAFVIATFPADILYGTMLLPDGVVPFWLALSVWSFLNADETSGRKAHLWYLAAGFFMFTGFITRENTYYFLLFFLPFAFSKRRWANGLYQFGTGFVVPVVVLYGFYFLKSGDFMYNLHLAEHYRDPLIASGYIPPNDRNWYSMLFMMLPGLFLRQNGTRLFMSGLYGYTMYVSLAAAVYTAIRAWQKRDARMLMAPWWFLLAYLYLEFGSISFTDYQMMKKLDRFLLTLTPAAAMMCGYALSEAFGLGARNLFRRRIIREIAGDFKNHAYIWISMPLAAFVLVFMLFTSYTTAANQKASRDANLAKFRWGYFDVLDGRENKPVYDTGGWWKNKLSFYFLPDIRYAEMPWRHTDMLRDLKAVAEPSELAGSYVIIDHSHFSGENDLRIQHAIDDFPSYVTAPPEEWELLGRRGGIEIYEVPEDWTYRPYEGSEYVKRAFPHALEVGNFQLFMHCLHPDLRSRLSEQQFISLVGTLANPNDNRRDDLMNNRIIYKTINGIWKVDFKLD